MTAFELQNTQCGCVTAIHSGTKVYMHSGVSPCAEAKAIAELSQSAHRQVLLVGNGLGYLSAELAKTGALYQAIELFSDLMELCIEHGVRGADSYCESITDFSSVLLKCPQDVSIIIAPYVLALRNELCNEYSKFIGDLQVTLQSQKVYRPLIDYNCRLNRERFATLEHFGCQQYGVDKVAIAAGAAPSLEASAKTLREYRGQILLAAASGALPVLARSGVTPDFVVAMEARDTSVGDFEYAPDDLNVIVFPWTNPAILTATRFNLLRADDMDNIFTSGGSTGLATADIAAKLSQGALFLVGMDMSDRSGEYSLGANRISANANIGAPKFNLMRNAAAQWNRQIRRTVYHMTMPGSDPISGAQKLYPMELGTAIDRELNKLQHLHTYFG